MRWGVHSSPHPAVIWEGNRYEVSPAVCPSNIWASRCSCSYVGCSPDHSLSPFSVLNFPENQPPRGASRSCPAQLHSLIQKVVEIRTVATCPGGARPTQLAEGLASWPVSAENNKEEGWQSRIQPAIRALARGLLG